MLIIASILIGCGTTTKTNSADIITGTEGITAVFSTNAPPAKVFENNNFPVLIKIKNVGAYSIPQNPAESQGVISIGREKDYVPVLSIEENSRLTKSNQQDKDNEMYFFVDGKSQINPQGDELIASLTATTGKLDTQSEHRVSAITANLCYPYKTMLSTTVCIDPDVAGLRPGKKVCSVADIPFANGQGAPIAITKIESLMVPEIDQEVIKPQFLIYVENKGSGNPINLAGFRQACGNDFDKNDPINNRWNVATLKAFTSSENGVQQLVCCPNIYSECPDNEADLNNPDKITGFIRLRDKKDFVRCTFRNGIPKGFDAYTSPLKIEIDYGYMQTISTNFVIQKPLKY